MKYEDADEPGMNPATEAAVDQLLRSAAIRLHTTIDVVLPARLPWDIPEERAASNPDADWAINQRRK